MSNHQEAVPTTTTLTPQQLAVLFVVSATTFLPCLLNWTALTKLFWFSDDFALLHDLSRLTYGEWLLSSFGENISPIFKLLWSTLVYQGQGSYIPMALALVIGHATIIFLFGWLLLRIGLGTSNTIACCLLIGLAPSQSNLLFFSYHLNAALALVFTLAAGHVFLSSPKSLRIRMLYFVILLCSLLSFSRGIVFAVALILAFFKLWLLSDRERPAHAGFYLIASSAALAVAIGLLLFGGALSSNPGTDFKNLLNMSQFGFYYWSLSPMYLLLPLGKQVPDEIVLTASFALGKLLVLISGYLIARKHSRTLGGFLLLLMLVDLGNTMLLGWGRYSEGLQAALVPRYQRTSLLTFVPVLVLVASALLTKLALRKQVSAYLVLTASTLVGLHFISTWNTQFYHHSRWQGSMGRRVVVKEKLKPQEKNLVPPWHGIPPVITYERAKELKREFSLQ